MDLINPFEPFGKAETWPPQRSTRLRALVRTGAHVGHGQDLSITRNSRGGGGKRTGLEVYRGRKSKVGKASGSVARGLAMTGGYSPSRVPVAAKQSGRVKRSLASRQDVNRRQLSMERLRGSINFGDAGSRGSRIG